MTEYEIISTLVFAYITVLLLYLNRKQRRELMKLLKDTCDKDTKTLTDIRSRVNTLIAERDELRDICANNNKAKQAAERRVRELEKEKLNNLEPHIAADKIKELENKIRAAEDKAYQYKQQAANLESLLKQARDQLAAISKEDKIVIDEYNTKQEEIEELLKQNDKHLISAAVKYGLTPHIGKSKKAAKSAPCVYIITVLDKTSAVKGYGGETKDPNKRWADNFAKYGGDFRDAIKDAGDNIRVIWATGDCLKDNRKRKEIESFIIESGDFVNSGYNKRGGSVNIKEEFSKLIKDVDLDRVWRYISDICNVLPKEEEKEDEVFITVRINPNYNPKTHLPQQAYNLVPTYGE